MVEHGTCTRVNPLRYPLAHWGTCTPTTTPCQGHMASSPVNVALGYLYSYNRPRSKPMTSSPRNGGIDNVHPPRGPARCRDRAARITALAGPGRPWLALACAHGCRPVGRWPLSAARACGPRRPYGAATGVTHCSVCDGVAWILRHGAAWCAKHYAGAHNIAHCTPVQ